MRLTFKVFCLRSETLDLGHVFKVFAKVRDSRCEIAKVSLRSQSLAANAAPVRSPLPFPIKVRRESLEVLDAMIFGPGGTIS